MQKKIKFGDDTLKNTFWIRGEDILKNKNEKLIMYKWFENLIAKSKSYYFYYNKWKPTHYFIIVILN